MSVEDWNWRHPVELQDVPWDCAAASTAWALQACGRPYTEAEVVAGLGPTRISPAYGLLDASGQGIVDWLASIGVTAESNPSATWSDVYYAAGHQPMIMGGRAWYHWTGVRISPSALGRPDTDALALANPAPGWMAVHQLMLPEDFEQLGAFSAVWFVAW